MELRKFYRYLSLNVWGGLPAILQRKSSKVYTRLYNTSFSKIFIKPYSRIQYKDREPGYLEQFRPASGNEEYETFQDFFIRKFRQPPKLINDSTWPCEGLLCEYDQVANLQEVKVKKQRQHLRNVFGNGGDNIPDNYFYSNVFLHNRDYHRIHAPTTGTVTRIEHIPGDLVLLRPWIYPDDPSHPALRNERYNVDITDNMGRTWYLSIVGGPAVGTISLNEKTVIDSTVHAGEEIATFLLGSTCCMASPIPVSRQIGDSVRIGQVL